MTQEYEEDIRTIEDVLDDPENGDVIRCTVWDYEPQKNSHGEYYLMYHDWVIYYKGKWYNPDCSCHRIYKDARKTYEVIDWEKTSHYIQHNITINETLAEISRAHRNI